MWLLIPPRVDICYWPGTLRWLGHKCFPVPLCQGIRLYQTLLYSFIKSLVQGFVSLFPMQVFKMIRANRNNQRRAQRRPEHAKDEEEVVVVEVVEEIGKDQAENYNVGGQADEHQVKHQTEEKLESNGEEDKEDRLEESLQQQHAEEAGSIRGSHPEPSLPCDKSRSPSEDDENKESSEIKERSRDVETRERSKEIESEAREEVPGLIYIDYSQFDEDEESYGLGGGLEDAYNLSQAGVTVDSSPIGMTDEKVEGFRKEI